MDSNTHSTRPAGRDTSSVSGAGRRAPGPGRPGPGPAGRRRLGRAGPGAARAGRPRGRPLAGRTGRPGCPRGRRGRTGGPGRLHRRVAPPPAAHERRRGRQPGADRPGPVPRPPHPDRPGCWPMGSCRPAHAQVLAAATQDLPDHVTAEAEPVLVEAARRLDPPRLRRAITHLRLVADPDGADRIRPSGATQQRGLWLSPTWEGMVALQGLLDPEAGQTLLAALEPLARPTTAHDTRSGGQRRADALTELARRSLESRPAPPDRWGATPAAGHRRPGQPPRPPWCVGGEAGGPWPLDPESCRRLACDSAVTRVLVTRQPPGPPAIRGPTAMTAWPPSCGQRRPGSPQPWAAPPPNRWRWAAPAASSPPPNAPPWPSATAAARSPAATDPQPGAKPTTSAIGSMAAPPTSSQPGPGVPGPSSGGP